MFWPAPEQTVEETIETPVIWNVIAPTVMDVFMSKGLHCVEFLIEQMITKQFLNWHVYDETHIINLFRPGDAYFSSVN